MATAENDTPASRRKQSGNPATQAKLRERLLKRAKAIVGATLQILKPTIDDLEQRVAAIEADPISPDELQQELVGDMELKAILSPAKPTTT